MTTAKHPWRCETCGNSYIKDDVMYSSLRTSRRICKFTKWNVDLYNLKNDLIGVVGCASHSSATSAEQVLGVLDLELEAEKSKIESSAMGQPLSERYRGEIMGLLLARAKIKQQTRQQAQERGDER